MNRDYEWKCDLCGERFNNFHAQGFDNKIYCPLCYFKRENQTYKEVIDKLNKYLRSNKYSKDYKIGNCRTTLLNILKEVE